MTDNITITLPRSVVKQALKALDEIAWSNDTKWQSDCADDARVPLRAAMEQPQVEQKPVAWQYRMRPDWGSKKDCWGPWQDCTMEQAAMYQRVPLLHDWAYESRQLYTHPQNLNCKSNQHRLATLWGYVKDQAPTNFEWKNAVIDELVCAHILTQEHETNPRKAIQDAITWNTQVALDPAVSSDAQALIDQGSSAERDRICKIVYGMCSSDNNAFEIVQAIKKERHDR